MMKFARTNPNLSWYPKPRDWVPGTSPSVTATESFGTYFVTAVGGSRFDARFECRSCDTTIALGYSMRRGEADRACVAHQRETYDRERRDSCLPGGDQDCH